MGLDYEFLYYAVKNRIYIYNMWYGGGRHADMVVDCGKRTAWYCQSWGIPWIGNLIVKSNPIESIGSTQSNPNQL